MAKTKGVKGIRLRVRTLPSGHRQQYLDIYRNGKRWTEPVPFGILTGDRFNDSVAKNRAEEYLKKRIADFEAGYGFNRSKLGKESFIDYCEKLQENYKTKNTCHSWRTAVKHLRDFNENCTFAELSREFFQKFRDYLLTKVSPNAAATYLARIKTAVHKAVNEGLLLSDPSKSITVKKTDRLPVFLTLDEVRKLSETPCGNEQVKNAFLFSCFSGLRYSDVDRLTWDRIRDGYIEFTQRKTGEAERLPLSAQAREILERQRGASVSPNLRRTFLENQVFFLPAQQVVDAQLKRWAKRAGLEKRISFHKARHTFATLSLTSGVDLYTVSKLLGHRDLETTQIYAKVVDEKKRKAVEALPTLGQG